MLGRVAALVVLVALAGCEARSFALDDASLGTLNRTVAPAPAKDVLFQVDTLAFALIKAAPSLACKSPPVSVSVPAGGSITITSPKSRSYASGYSCGWDFTTVPGSDLSLKCQKFSLVGSNQFYVYYEKNGSPLDQSYFEKNSPTLEPGVQTASMYFMYDTRGSKSSFSCTVTSVTPCKCGIVNRSTRIVGGANTEVREYPWQVALVSGKRNLFCGATLISDRHIATAAHCMKGQTTSSIQLLLGGHTRTKPTASEIIVKPLRFFVHPQYGVNSTLNHDLAIIEITPLDFNDPKVLVRPICLPDSTGTYEGVTATTTGWGRLSTNGTQPDILQELDVPVVSNSDCTSAFGSSITDNMICTSDLGQKGICFGDSGGPLVAPDGANYELIGVTSFTSSDGCALGQYYSGFTRVTAEMFWIQSNTATSTTCGR